MTIMIPNQYFIPLFFLLSFTTSFASESPNGFTIDLIHRDSSLSPLHNPSESTFDRLANALRRSSSRLPLFTSSKASQIQSSLFISAGEYLMNLSIGTPPIPMLGIADTGSDLIWTQCNPCTKCYTQESPIFDPNKSSSFKNLPCNSDACRSVGTSNCTTGTCSYHYAYGDSSHTDGNLATETISFVGPNSFTEIVIGCGHDNAGTFTEKGSGLVGLGGGPLSLVSQLTNSLNGKFAYCLVPLSNIEAASKMSFGTNAIASSAPGVVSTPLVKKDPNTFYYVTLESVTVGETVLNYKASLCGSSGTPRDVGFEKGNIIIDSGTTLTLLPRAFYDDLEKALADSIEGERVEAQGKEGWTLNLCYRSNEEMKFPIIRAKFEGGEVELNPSNTFLRVGKEVVCLAMRPASDVAIFGNMAQMDFLVSYDLEEGKVSFEPMDCSKHGG